MEKDLVDELNELTWQNVYFGTDTWQSFTFTINAAEGFTTAYTIDRLADLGRLLRGFD